MTPLEKAQLFSQLAVLLDSGLTVHKSLIAIAKKSPSRLGRYLGKAILSLGRGEELSAALGRVPRIFDPWTTSLLNVAAQSGALPEMFWQLAKLERQEWDRQNFYRSVRLAAVTSGVSLLLLLATLLYTTKASSGSWLLGCLLVAVVGLALPKLAPRLPWVRRARTARAMLYLGQLELPLRCGLPILMAIELVRDRIPKSEMAGTLTVALGQIPAGKTLSQSLEDRLPATAIRTIRAGEETGQLDWALYQIRTHYEGELERSLRVMQGILIPITLLAAGGVVALLSLNAMKSLFILLPS
ncbi:MAG: type II secretion system F family protein [Limnospira sp.]